ncbi:MAG: hypothetical protein RIB78_05135 [Gammaproteobacteria bacterium]
MNGRPLGITIIAWLYIVAGTAFLATQGPVLLEPNLIRDALTTIGSTIPLYLFQTGLISIAMALCGIGMLKGQFWSWWLGVFLEGNTIVFSIYSLIIVGASFPLMHQLKQVVPLVIAVVVLIYLFREKTMSFFQIKKPVLASTLGVVFAVNLGAVLLLGALRV